LITRNKPIHGDFTKLLIESYSKLNQAYFVTIDWSGYSSFQVDNLYSILLFFLQLTLS